MAVPNLENLQGDLFSRGFPKYKETYYFFTIVPGKEEDFTKSLSCLGRSGQISSLKKVLEDWTTIDCTPRDFIIPISNALIAFTKTGLEKVQLGLPDTKSLGLENLTKSDPAFARGMAKDGPKNLHDPPHEQWDAPFNTKHIHGVVKVAGKSQGLIESKLKVIKIILGHPTVIVDVGEQSKMDGQVRPKEKGLKGHEHFGFRDGISQPLLDGIDTTKLEKSRNMRTPHNVITVTDNPPAAQDGGSKIDPFQRPKWMVEGSFLVFRKLEQGVEKYEQLTQKFKEAHCTSPDHFGAKLMGRWKSGAPITLYPDADPIHVDPATKNDFKFGKPNICPFAAHIRKTNPRDDMFKTVKSRIVRNGIPYGPEYTPGEDKNKTKRGLLFACYSSSIDNGFKFIQQNWSNNPKFPVWKTTAGQDAFIGQTAEEKDFHITMFDKDDEAVTPGLGMLPKLVAMRGGEYFFVPSISALSDMLGGT